MDQHHTGPSDQIDRHRVSAFKASLGDFYADGSWERIITTKTEEIFNYGLLGVTEDKWQEIILKSASVGSVALVYSHPSKRPYVLKTQMGTGHWDQAPGVCPAAEQDLGRKWLLSG